MEKIVIHIELSRSGIQEALKVKKLMKELGLSIDGVSIDTTRQKCVPVDIAEEILGLKVVSYQETPFQQESNGVMYI